MSSSALAISTSSRRSRWLVKPGLWFIDDLVSGHRAVNALAVPLSGERVRRSMLCVARGAWPLVFYKSGSPLASRPGVISKRRSGWPAGVP
jgi:hypothetical protein